jgi:ribonuclease BN (tRNA processing enzyme)
MCDLCERSETANSASHQISRRSVLAGAGGLAAAAGLAASAGSARAAVHSPAPAAEGKLQVVLLGTQAGPPMVQDRTGIATALVVDGHVYLIDCGRAAATQYVRSGLPLKNLAAILLTHLHADHVADYYNFFLLGGFVPQPGKDNLVPPIQVYGPGPAGGLPPKFGGGQAPVVNPADPTPGTKALTAACTAAYAYSSNVFIRDSNIPDIETLMQVHEIRVPDVGSSYTNTAPVMRPFPVMADDRVEVTGILVPHGPVYPAFAFRFDTAYGSVTFSGDTTYTENIPTLAHNTDLLIHEAINVQGAQQSPAFIHHLLTSHVEVQKVGPIAEKAGARRLVLSHIADLAHDIVNHAINVSQWTKWAQQGYNKGKASIGQDLQRITLA